jgi:hypothetical protein
MPNSPNWYARSSRDTEANKRENVFIVRVVRIAHGGWGIRHSVCEGKQKWEPRNEYLSQKKDGKN